MRARLIMVATMAILVAFSSCKNKGNTGDIESANKELPIYYEMSSQDTANVLSMVNQFIESLQGEKYDDAVGMLNYYDGESIVNLPESRASMQKLLFKRLHGQKYVVENYRFKKETDNLVTIGVYFEVDSTAVNVKPDLTIALNPIKMNNDWHLTIVDNITDKSEGSMLHK